MSDKEIPPTVTRVRRTRVIAAGARAPAAVLRSADVSIAAHRKLVDSLQLLYWCLLCTAGLVLCVWYLVGLRGDVRKAA